jgi:hypothetical protein
MANASWTKGEPTKRYWMPAFAAFAASSGSIRFSAWTAQFCPQCGSISRAIRDKAGTATLAFGPIWPRDAQRFRQDLAALLGAVEQDPRHQSARLAGQVVDPERLEVAPGVDRLHGPSLVEWTGVEGWWTEAALRASWDIHGWRIIYNDYNEICIVSLSEKGINTQCRTEVRMDMGMAVFVGLVVAAALAGFAVYRWRMRRRARRVEGWVRDYLVGSYGKLPGGLHVDCSDDELWPVLVAFDDPATGARHRLRFSCAGPDSAFSLASDEGAARSANQVQRAAEDRADVARFEGDGGRCGAAPLGRNGLAAVASGEEPGMNRGSPGVGSVRPSSEVW